MNLFTEARHAMDSDLALQHSLTALVETRAVRHALGLSGTRYEGQGPLKLLLVGYVGSRNTGADVRVEEMIRQFRAVLGDEHVELTALTIDPAKTAGYFRAIRQVRIPPVFPTFLFSECSKHHGVVACEGSMFKSKFSNALTALMAGAMGMAGAEGKLAVGYGGEAGAMDPNVARFVQRHCKRALVLCRNEPSRRVLDELGIRNGGGADTAWTFNPAPRERAEQLLRTAGWDGHAPIVAVCPINPFGWPVRPDLLRTVSLTLSGQHREEHYKSIYFHPAASTYEAKTRQYITALATSLKAFLEDHEAFPILVGMERLDRRACEALSEALGREVPTFISDDYDMYDLVAILRRAALLVSSRYHALVTTMPARVPSIGLAMDERVRNLMNERGQDGLCFESDAVDLPEKLLSAMRLVWHDSERVADQIGRAVPAQLQRMGQMGLDFVDEVCRVYPSFPRRPLPRTWSAHLPPISGEVAQTLERYA